MHGQTTATGMPPRRHAEPKMLPASRLVPFWRATSYAAAGMVMLAMPKARAGQEEGLSACEAGDWSTAAWELAAEEATTTDALVVRCLADMYFGGLVMRRDPAKAFQPWKKLADLGNDEAQDMV